MNAALAFGISALIALAVSAFITIGIIVLARYFRMRAESRSHSPIDPIVFNQESNAYDEENGIPLSRFDTPEPVYFPDGPRHVHFQRYNLTRPDSQRSPPVYLNKTLMQSSSPPPSFVMQRTTPVKPLPRIPQTTISLPQPLHRHACIYDDTNELIDQF